MPQPQGSHDTPLGFKDPFADLFPHATGNIRQVSVTVNARDDRNNDHSVNIICAIGDEEISKIKPVLGEILRKLKH